MRILVTGGCGFSGKHLIFELLKKKHEVAILDNLSGKKSRDFLKEIESHGAVDFFQVDLVKYKHVINCISEYKPQFIFHLAGQRSIKSSLKNPASDAEINIIGTLNLLEAVRHNSPESPLVFSSTSYVYGKIDYIELLEDSLSYTASQYPNGFSEVMKKDAHLPNTCSIGSAEQYVLDYKRLYGLQTVVFRQSQIIGEKNYIQDEDFIEHIIKSAVEQKSGSSKKTIEIYGNGKDVCDILHIDDLICCYITSMEYFDRINGEILNIGGGVENSLSKLGLLKFLEEKLSIKIKYKLNPEKKSRQKFYTTNFQKARSLMHWGPKKFRESILQNLIEFYLK